MAKEKLSGGKNGKPYSTDVGIPQRRFYLGHNSAEASNRKELLQALWNRMQKLGEKQWTEFYVDVANAIRQGKTTMTVDTGGSPDEFSYRIGIDATNKALDGLMTFVATDKKAYHALDDLREKWAEAKKAIRANAQPGGHTSIADTLDAYRNHVKASKLDPTTKQPSEWAIRLCQLTEFVERQIPKDMTLREFNYAQIEKLCIEIANRPTSKRGKPITAKYASHVLKAIRVWIKWTSKHFHWQKPEDWLDAAQQKPVVTNDEKAAKAHHIKNVTHTLPELVTLHRYANPIERAILLLGLNCGFGAMEISTLRRNELYSENGKAVICRTRQKSAIYGEWELWPETVAALDNVKMPTSEFVLCRKNGSQLVQKTPAGRSNKVANAWIRLQKRIEKDEPTFRRLSFNKIRKTGASAMRKIGGGEVSSLYLAHGKTTSDDLLEVYASRDYSAVFQALAKLREVLSPIFQTTTTNARAIMPLSKIDAIKAGWNAGEKPELIATKTGSSRATVYRYRPARAE